MLLSAFSLLKSLKKTQPVKLKSIVIQMGVSIAVLIFYILVLNVNPPTSLSLSLLAAGAAFGAIWSRSTSLAVTRGVVYSKRSLWYMVAWIASIALTQTLSLTATRELVTYGISTIYLTTGIGFGTNFSVIIRHQRLLAARVTSQLVCSFCGSKASKASKFCNHCGRKLV